MIGNALPGVLVLLAVSGVTALGELPQAWASVHDGRVRVEQVGRVFVTGGLLWWVWAGADWARWLTTGLFLVGAGGQAAVARSAVSEAAAPVLVWWPEQQPLGLVFGVAYAMCAVGLVCPWVGAYQAARRRHRHGEPATTDYRGGV